MVGDEISEPSAVAPGLTTHQPARRWKLKPVEAPTEAPTSTTVSSERPGPSGAHGRGNRRVGKKKTLKLNGWNQQITYIYIYNRKGKSPFENLHLLCSKFIFQAIHGGDLVRVPSFLPKVSEKFLDLGWFNDIFSDGMLWFVVFQQEWIGARKGIPVFLDSLGRK